MSRGHDRKERAWGERRREKSARPRELTAPGRCVEGTGILAFIHSGSITEYQVLLLEQGTLH